MKRSKPKPTATRVPRPMHDKDIKERIDYLYATRPWLRSRPKEIE